MVLFLRAYKLMIINASYAAKVPLCYQDFLVLSHVDYAFATLEDKVNEDERDYSILFRFLIVLIRIEYKGVTESNCVALNK